MRKETLKRLRAIYVPRRAAGEYAKLGLNVLIGCSHTCRYCYGPAASRSSRAKFFRHPYVRKDILEKIEHDATILKEAGCQDTILISFLSDPYQMVSEKLPSTRVVREALEILGAHGLQATVLTKGGSRAGRDFDVLREFGFGFGTSLVWGPDANEYLVKRYEPWAGCWRSRPSWVLWRRESARLKWSSCRSS